MEPGREGGIWFGFTTKELGGDKGKKYCVAALLNITGEKIEPADGRGRIVKNYLKTDLDFHEYIKSLAARTFSGYNFVAIELSKDGTNVYHYSNSPQTTTVYSGKKTLGFGNGPTYVPLTKVTTARYWFEEIVNKDLGSEKLVEELLELLKDRTSYLPDEELEKR